MEIPFKFRAKEIKTGEWIEGDLHLLCRVPHIHVDLTHQYAINTDTICVFTRLHDKKDKEVYDGDLISIPLSDGSKAIYEIHISEDMLSVEIRNTKDILSYHKNMFNVLRYSWWKEYQSEIEVIGNKYDNPELVK